MSRLEPVSDQGSSPIYRVGAPEPELIARRTYDDLVNAIGRNTAAGAPPDVGSGADVGEHLRRIAAEGYTVVEGVLTDDEADATAAELQRLELALAVEPASNDFEGRSTRRVYNLLAHGPLFESIAVHPTILPIVEGVLDAGCLISSLSSVAIGPGEQAQPIHADDQLLPLPKPHAPTVCNTMWALTPFTADNGATRVVPRSHLADTSPDYGRPYDSVAAEMTKGSVLVWHGSLWHGGGANITERTRVGIAINYCAGWLRQQENQQLGLSRERVETFGLRLRELVGYGVYHGLIGHIERRTPAETLLESGARTNLWDRTT